MLEAAVGEGVGDADARRAGIALFHQQRIARDGVVQSAHALVAADVVQRAQHPRPLAVHAAFFRNGARSPGDVQRMRPPGAGILHVHSSVSI